MWIIERQHCSGNQCARNIYTADTQDEAIDRVLGELEWMYHGDALRLRFVMQDNDECYEDQATSDLMHGEFEYTTSSNCRIAYRLREQTP